MQERRLPGGLHRVEKRRENLGAERHANESGLEAVVQRRAIGECRLARLLHRLAGEEAARRLVTRQRAGLDERLKHVVHPLAGAQQGFLVRGGGDDHVAHVGRPHIVAQIAVQLLVGGGDGAHAGEVILPQIASTAGYQRRRDDHQHEQRGAEPSGLLNHPEQRRSVSNMAGAGEILSQQAGQHEPRHRQGDRQTDDGEDAELHEAGEAGEQHRGKAADRDRDTEPQCRPDQAQRRARAAVWRRLGRQIDGVVHGFADQGHAEADRDAMHEAEPEAHRRQPGHRARCDRNQDQKQHAGRAVD